MYRKPLKIPGILGDISIFLGGFFMSLLLNSKEAQKGGILYNLNVFLKVFFLYLLIPNQKK